MVKDIFGNVITLLLCFSKKQDAENTVEAPQCLHISVVEMQVTKKNEGFTVLGQTVRNRSKSFETVRKPFDGGWHELGFARA